MQRGTNLQRRNLRVARNRWGIGRGHIALQILDMYSQEYRFSLSTGDLLFLNQNWYVTHAGLLRLSRRRHCRGIDVNAVPELCNTSLNRYAFRAMVYTSSACKGFVGYGDADPSNVSPLVHGAEMRVAETRAVNRALRKAYGIGICSVEEIGSFAEPAPSPRASKKVPAQPVNGNYGGPKVRDRLCQLIRQHQLDANLVKSYAVDFCGTKTLREASRQHETLFRVSPASGCVRHSLGSGRALPGPGGSGAISLAQAKALLRDPLRRPQTQASDRLLHDWPAILHT